MINRAENFNAFLLEESSDIVHEVEILSFTSPYLHFLLIKTLNLCLKVFYLKKPIFKMFC